MRKKTRFRHPTRFLWPSGSQLRFYEDYLLLHKINCGKGADRLFDVHDFWSMTGGKTDAIGITCKNWKTYTDARVKKIIWKLKYDFEYEGYKVKYKIDKGCVGQAGKQELRFKIKIIENDCYF